jgi:plastocyanin
MGKTIYGRVISATLLLLIATTAVAMSIQLTTRVSAQSTGKTWYVDIGGTLPGFPTDEGYGFYPHMIVIDAGDTVVWTVVTAEEHTVTFFSGQQSFNGFSPVSVLPMPCSPSAPNVYNGTGICSSGLLLQGSQYNLTFTKPGVYVYSCAFHPGMQGVVVVQPKGSPYPYTQEQYNAIAEQEMVMDLETIQTVQNAYQPVVTSGPNNTMIYHVAVGYQPPQFTTATLSAVNGSGITGNVSIQVTGPQTALVNLTLTGLTAGKSYSAALLFGSSQYGEATGYSPINLGSFTPTSATYSTIFTVRQNLSVVVYDAVELPMAGLYVNVYSGSTQTNTVATGDIMYSNGGIMSFLPTVLTIYAGDTVVWTEQEPNDGHTVTYVPSGMQTPVFGVPSSLELIGNNTVFNPSNYYNSGPLVYGQSYALTFDTPGVYTIQCLIHNTFGMSGYIIVLPKPTGTTQVVNQVTTVVQQTTLPGTTVVQHFNTTIAGPTTDSSARLLAVAGILLGVVALGVAVVAARRK